MICVTHFWAPIHSPLLKMSSILPFRWCVLVPQVRSRAKLTQSEDMFGLALNPEKGD
jgi:hypothetical protein